MSVNTPDHPPLPPPVDTIRVVAFRLASGWTQAATARDLHISRQRVSAITRRLVVNGVLVRKIRSNINIYEAGPNYDDFLSVNPPTTEGGHQGLTLTPKTPPRARPPPPGPQQTSPHRRDVVALPLEEPDPARLAARGWSVKYQKHGGWKARIETEEWTACWSKGPRRNRMQVWPKRRKYKAETREDLVEAKKDYERRAVAGLAWLERYWGFRFGLPEEGSNPWEWGFAQLDPVVEAWLRKVGMVRIEVPGGDPVILDWSKDDERVLVWARGEIETGLERALTWVAAAEMVPGLQRDVREIKAALEPPSDWEAGFA